MFWACPKLTFGDDETYLTPFNDEYFKEEERIANKEQSEYYNSDRYIRLHYNGNLQLKHHRVGGGSPRVILISGKNQNCPFLKTDSLADTFFWAKKFQTNAKCYGEKVLKIFLTLKKSFVQDTFLEKKFCKIV